MRRPSTLAALLVASAVLPLSGAAATPKKKTPTTKAQTKKQQPTKPPRPRVRPKRRSEPDLAVRSTITLSAIDPLVDTANHLRMKLHSGVTMNPTSGRWGTLEMHGRCEVYTPLGALAGVPRRNHVELRFRAESIRPYSVECLVTAGQNRDGETVVPKITVDGTTRGTTWNPDTGRLAAEISAKLGDRDLPVRICGTNGGIEFHMCNVIPRERIEP